MSARFAVGRVSGEVGELILLIVINNVSDLDVYVMSMDLLKKIYDFTNKLPRSELSTQDQIRRASKSIPANIAEGFAKKISSKEFKRFLTISLGSSDEVVTHLKMVEIIVPQMGIDATNLENEFIILSKRINKLRSCW